MISSYLFISRFEPLQAPSWHLCIPSNLQQAAVLRHWTVPTSHNNPHTSTFPSSCHFCARPRVIPSLSCHQVFSFLHSLSSHHHFLVCLMLPFPYKPAWWPSSSLLFLLSDPYKAMSPPPCFPGVVSGVGPLGHSLSSMFFLPLRTPFPSSPAGVISVFCTLQVQFDSGPWHLRLPLVECASWMIKQI